MKTLLILGAGTAGTIMANKMAHKLDLREWRIVVVDKDETHYYQPGFLFIPFGIYGPDDVRRPKRRYLPLGVDVIFADIERIEPEASRVVLSGKQTISYDQLIIATGTRVVPEETPGLADGGGWRQNIFDFYTFDGAVALSKFLRRWPGGRMVVNVAEMPIKCPVAPLEFLFLAHAFFTEKGMRDKVEIVYATPLPDTSAYNHAMPRAKSVDQGTRVPVLPEGGDEFLRDVGGTSERTVSSYRTGLLALQAFAEDSKLTKRPTPLGAERIRIELLAGFYSWMRARNYANATVRLYLAAARQYLRWLAAERRLPTDIRLEDMVRRLEDKAGRHLRRIPPQTRSATETVVLLLDEAARRLSDPSLTPRRRLIALRDHAFVATLYATAGRLSEVLSLTRSAIGGGHSRRALVTGKGNKERYLLFTPDALAAVRAYLAAREDTSPWLFVSHGRGAGRPISTVQAWSVVRALARAALGKEARIHPHLFRHARLQALVDEGMSIETAQVVAGHASVATTRAVYAKQTRDDRLLDEFDTFTPDRAEAIRRARASHERR